MRVAHLTTSSLFGAIALATAFCHPANTQTGNRQSVERELSAVLQWEILWNDLPQNAPTPRTPEAQVALASKLNSIWYCSQAIGACAHYKAGPYRNWERDAGAIFPGGTDREALQSFISQTTRGFDAQAGGPRKPVLGSDGLTGLPAAGSEAIWTSLIALKSREETIRSYKRYRTRALSELKRWITASGQEGAGTRSITIACFAPTDPLVYYYVDRTDGEPLIVAAFFDRERASWIVASSRRPSQGRQGFDTMFRTIKAVECSTLRFTN